MFVAVESPRPRPRPPPPGPGRADRRATTAARGSASTPPTTSTEAIGLYRSAGYVEVPGLQRATPRPASGSNASASRASAAQLQLSQRRSSGSGSTGAPWTWISKWRWQPTRDRVAGLADRADPLPRPDPLAPVDAGAGGSGARRSSCGPRLRRGSAGSCRRGPGRSRRACTLPVAAATSSVPQAATMSKPSWVRPPLRGAPNSPMYAPRPVRPLDREDVAEVAACRRRGWRCWAEAGRGERREERTRARRAGRFSGVR